MDLVIIQDFINRTHIRETAKFLHKTDFGSKEELDEIQLKKLQRLISHSYQNVPFYKKLFDSVGLNPKDIQSLDDLKKIPIVSKEVVRKSYDQMVASDIDLNGKRIREAKTGGTTGMPLKFYKNDKTRDFTWGSYRRWYDWMGVLPSDRVAVLWGARTVLSSKTSISDRFIKLFGNTLKINSFDISNDTIADTAQKLIDYKPVLLRGYLSAIFNLAVYFKKNDLRIPTLKAISSTTETLLPIYREYIEKTFGVSMYDQYGCGECNAIAYECNAHEGLHVTEEHCIVEVLDKNNEPCFDKLGRIIVTDLDNDVFPFIRYEIGDDGLISSKKCSCGRNSALIKYISGRTKDTIYLKDGSEVHGVFFTDIFHELGLDNFQYFTRFQIYQEKKGDFNCRLEQTGAEIPPKKMEEIEAVLHRFGNNVKIDFMSKLENDPSGKFRYIISNIKE